MKGGCGGLAGRAGGMRGGCGLEMARETFGAWGQVHRQATNAVHVAATCVLL